MPSIKIDKTLVITYFDITMKDDHNDVRYKLQNPDFSTPKRFQNKFSVINMSILVCVLL